MKALQKIVNNAKISFFGNSPLTSSYFRYKIKSLFNNIMQTHYLMTVKIIIIHHIFYRKIHTKKILQSILEMNEGFSINFYIKA